MRSFLLILFFPLFSVAQFNHGINPNEKLTYKVKIISDSGTIKGYYVANTDSVFILSNTKKYLTNTTLNIPVNTIKELQLREKTGANLLGIAAGSIIGFTLAAGLIQNDTDTNYDGKTSFWELLFAAIKGTTSSDRRRRNTAFIAGAAGGTAFLVAGFFVNKKMSIIFPLKNRDNFYNQKKITLPNYTRF